MTKTPSLDPNLLAALIDGRLDAAQAEQVRQQMSSVDDDTLSAYADAMMIAAEVSDTEVPIVGSSGGKTPDDLRQEKSDADELAPTSSDRLDDTHASEASRVASEPLALVQDASLKIGIAAKPRKKARSWRVWLIPAVAAAAALSFVMLQMNTNSPEYNLSVAFDLPASSAMPDQPWGATRGALDDQTEVSRATRTGVLVMNVLALNSRGDSIANALRLLESTVQGALGGQTAASGFAELRKRTGERVRNEEIEKLAKSAFDLVGPQYAQTGAFLEIVRICLATPDATMFERLVPGQIPDDKTISRLSAPHQEQMKNLIAKINQNPRDYVLIEAEANRLLSELTR